MVNTGKDDRDYKSLMTINIEPENTIHGIVFEFPGIGPYFIEDDICAIFSYPIEIRIDAYGFYHLDQHESEDEDEGEEPPRVSMPFKTDRCVVCLTNEPKILFYNCLHYCVCSECEQEGHDGPVSLHWLIREIHSYHTLHYLGIGLKHKTPYKDENW